MIRFFPKIGEDIGLPDNLRIKFTNFENFLRWILNNNFLISHNNHLLNIKDIIIDFAVGDIYIYYPEVHLHFLDENLINKLSNREKYGIFRKLGELSSVKVKRYNKFYIFKNGIQQIDDIILYDREDKVTYNCNISNIEFNNYTSEDILNLLIFRELSKVNNKGIFKGSVAVNKNLLDIHDKLGLKVIENNLTIPRPIYRIPNIERHYTRNFEHRPDLDRREISLLLDLTLFSVIYNKTNLKLHDGTLLMNMYDINSKFFKIKDENYYLIMYKEWFMWSNK